MTKRIAVPFANAGDKTAVPDASQPDGKVSYTDGFTFDYQRPLASSPLSKNVPRDGFNQLFFDITEILKQVQDTGYSEWFAGVAYANYAWLNSGAGVYVSTENSNSVTPVPGIQEWAQVKIPISEDHEGNIHQYWPVDSAVGSGTTKTARLACDTTTIGAACQNVAVFASGSITVGDSCTDAMVAGSNDINIGTSSKVTVLGSSNSATPILGTNIGMIACYGGININAGSGKVFLGGSQFGDLSIIDCDQVGVINSGSASSVSIDGSGNSSVIASVSFAGMEASSGMAFLGSDNSEAHFAQNSAVIGGTYCNITGLDVSNSMFQSAIIGSGHCKTDNILGHSHVVLASENVVSDTDYEVVLGYAASGSPSANNITIRLNSKTGIIASRNFSNLKVATTSATPAVLSKNGSAPVATNQILLADNSALRIEGEVIALSDASDAKAWQFVGIIKRGTGAASTALVAAITPTVDAADAGAAAWDIAITADTTLGAVTVTATGAAATNINWNSTIRITETKF